MGQGEEETDSRGTHSQGQRKRSFIRYQEWAVLHSLVYQDSLLKLGSASQGQGLVKKRTPRSLDEIWSRECLSRHPGRPVGEKSDAEGGLCLPAEGLLHLNQSTYLAASGEKRDTGDSSLLQNLINTVTVKVGTLP